MDALLDVHVSLSAIFNADATKRVVRIADFNAIDLPEPVMPEKVSVPWGWTILGSTVFMLSRSIYVLARGPLQSQPPTSLMPEQWALKLFALRLPSPASAPAEQSVPM